jgi:hypothetical protein
MTSISVSLSHSHCSSSSSCTQVVGVRQLLAGSNGRSSNGAPIAEPAICSIAARSPRLHASQRLLASASPSPAANDGTKPGADPGNVVALAGAAVGTTAVCGADGGDAVDGRSSASSDEHDTASASSGSAMTVRARIPLIGRILPGRGRCRDPLTRQPRFGAGSRFTSVAAASLSRISSEAAAAHAVRNAAVANDQ